MFRILIVGALLLGLSGAADGAPPIFSAQITNRWFPLHPGSRYVYTGEKDGQASRDVVTVTPRVQTIRGAPCVGVDDRLFVRGKLAERTTDWYTQDANGNVWYYGESTAELGRNGRVTSTEGSWQAGVRGARPGIFMPAQPRRGESFRQEFYKGHAEDHFMVLSVLGDNAVLTKEWTPLEPGVIDHKLYVRGVGTVFEQTERGGSERNELVSFTGS